MPPLAPGRRFLPEIATQAQGDLPRYRRSRIRMRARKWRLGRVRANPIAYAMGLSAAGALAGLDTGRGRRGRRLRL